MVILRTTTTATRDLHFKVISERPMILTFECLAFSELTITTYCNVLGLTQMTLPVQAGFELTISWMADAKQEHYH
jgi:hypothetical protein